MRCRPLAGPLAGHLFLLARLQAHRPQAIRGQPFHRRGSSDVQQAVLAPVTGDDNAAVGFREHAGRGPIIAVQHRPPSPNCWSSIPSGFNRMIAAPPISALVGVQCLVAMTTLPSGSTAGVFIPTSSPASGTFSMPSPSNERSSEPAESKRATASVVRESVPVLQLNPVTMMCPSGTGWRRLPRPGRPANALRIGHDPGDHRSWRDTEIGDRRRAARERLVRRAVAVKPNYAERPVNARQ